ncbi:MAG: hypothetical protein ACR2KF_01920 [Nitrososphaeraceae archaeon]
MHYINHPDYIFGSVWHEAFLIVTDPSNTVEAVQKVYCMVV